MRTKRKAWLCTLMTGDFAGNTWACEDRDAVVVLAPTEEAARAKLPKTGFMTEWAVKVIEVIE